MNSNDEINALKAEIVRLNDKIHAMRGLLWEWNCSSGPVWEHWKLMKVGEMARDYSDWIEDEDMDLPFIGDDENV